MLPQSSAIFIRRLNQRQPLQEQHWKNARHQVQNDATEKPKEQKRENSARWRRPSR